MSETERDISAELAIIDAMTDDDIDYGDIPPVRDWSGAVRGKFYRPEKHAVSIHFGAKPDAA